VCDTYPMQDKVDTTKGYTMNIGSKHDMTSINIYHVIAIVAHDGIEPGDVYAKYPTWVDADRACTSHNARYVRTHGVVCEVVNMR
jgi:hypothetical protein